MLTDMFPSPTDNTCALIISALALAFIAHDVEQNHVSSTACVLWTLRCVKARRREMGEEASPPLIQVTNVSPQATDQQMKELFSYLGRIKDIKVYPGRSVQRQPSSCVSVYL